MTITQDWILNAVVIIAFQSGGFYFVARTWKRAVNGHLDKLDMALGEIQEEIAKTREDISEMKGYCRARTQGGGCE